MEKPQRAANGYSPDRPGQNADRSLYQRPGHLGKIGKKLRTPEVALNAIESGTRKRALVQIRSRKVAAGNPWQKLWDSSQF